MKINLEFTPFRRMIRPLSIYSEKSRSEGSAPKLKWQSDNELRIFGYPSMRNRIRLSLVRLNNKSILQGNVDAPDFLTGVPEISGMGTVSDGEKVVIETRPKQDYLTMYSNDFSYNIEKVRRLGDLKFEQYYLPMEQIKISASIQASIFKKFLRLARGGPLKLKISNESVEFLSKEMLGEWSGDCLTLDITNDSNVHTEQEFEYKYNIYLMFEALRKFPSKGQIELFANGDIIQLRYSLNNDLGSVSYYQRGK